MRTSSANEEVLEELFERLCDRVRGLSEDPCADSGFGYPPGRRVPVTG